VEDARNLPGWTHAFLKDFRKDPENRDSDFFTLYVPQYPQLPSVPPPPAPWLPLAHPDVKNLDDESVGGGMGGFPGDFPGGFSGGYPGF